MSWLFDNKQKDAEKRSSEEIYREKIGDVRIRVDKILERQDRSREDRSFSNKSK